MFNSISNLVSQPYFYVPVLAVTACLMAVKVFQIVKPIFLSLANKIYENTFITNFRSLFCRKCAERHKSHSLSVKVPSVTKRVDTPITRSSEPDQIPKSLTTPTNTSLQLIQSFNCQI